MQELTTENFETTITGDRPVLVDFFATWCGPCTQMAPILEELDQSNDKVSFAKVDVDQQKPIAEKHNVRGIPCMVLFSKGKEVDRFVGVTSKDDLQSKLDSIVG